MTNLKSAQSDGVIFALDIGTTKVCALAGKRSPHGKVELLGIGKVHSEGVLRGVVSNIEKTVNAIKEAIHRAEQQSGYKAEIVHVGIAGQHIKSIQHRGILTRDHPNTEITDRDIARLIQDMYKLLLPPGDRILHVIPQEFTVDHEQGIVDPIGMSGVRLEANFHIITGQISASNNIYRCIQKCGLKVADMTLEPIASSESVLNHDEIEAGVALVDIGGGTTDITIFHDGIIRHTAVIPFGGNVVTKDIKEGCRVMIHQAEKLKLKFGAALAEEVYNNRIITIPGLRGHEPKEISEKNLARIIQARIEEILDYVVWEIQRSGYERKIIGGIVLTGGGALLRHMDKLTAYHTGMSTRIGLPIEGLANGYTKEVVSPIYATGIGLLIKGIEDVESGRIRYQHMSSDEETEEKEPVTTARDEKWYEQLFRRTKEWFEAEPDVEF